MRLALALIATAVVVSSPSPADAGDRRPCVSKDELQGIRNGWKQFRIERYTETRGVLVEARPNGLEVWHYQSCRPTDTAVVITYDQRHHWLSIARY